MNLNKIQMTVFLKFCGNRCEFWEILYVFAEVVSVTTVVYIVFQTERVSKFRR